MKGSDPRSLPFIVVVEPGRGVALGPNKWGVSWVPDSTELLGGQRQDLAAHRPHVLSACAGAEIPSRPTLSVAVTIAMATLRAMFMFPLHLLDCGSHG